MPGHEGELVYLDDIHDLQEFARGNNAILIPHHPAYQQGWRGQNWSVLDPIDVSPVVEVFSEHGNAESDRAPFRYIRHSMGGRYTKNTVQYLLGQGHQVGLVASTDDHLGYPGAYGEGLVAVHADTLTRESVMEAIKARRTYGVSADRIALDFKLNGHWMGETLPAVNNRTISVRVKGQDVVDRVEVLRNNKVIYRNHPIDNDIGKSSWEKPILCRIEFGWGPWDFFNMERITDWEFDVHVTNGKIISATPCFQSGPYDEDRRNKITTVEDNHCQFISFTSRKQAYEERATNSIVLEIQGSPGTELDLSIARPGAIRLKKTLGELAESSDIIFTENFPSESIMIHRIVFNENYQTSFEFTDKPESDTTDWYYVRVTQSNGSLAWSSPVWVETSIP
jgi:ribulose bisphosphate carboxylase small subunit